MKNKKGVSKKMQKKYSLYGYRWESWEEANECVKNETNLDIIQNWFPLLPISIDLIHPDNISNSKNFNELGKLIAKKLAILTDNFDDFHIIADSSFYEALYEKDVISKIVSMVKTKDDFQFILPYIPNGSPEIKRLKKIKLTGFM